MGTYSIGGRPIGPNEPTYIIAEAGSNHNGSLSTAKELIDTAADAGADAVKFQTFRANRMYPTEGEIDINVGNVSAYEFFKDIEMPYEWIPELNSYAHENDIEFLSSPFDQQSADKLEEFVPAYKIGSSMLTHHPFLKHICQKNKPIIISTGAQSLADVSEAMEVIKKAGGDKVVLLQCTTSYPTPVEKANLRVVTTLREEFDTLVGFSDHTEDIELVPGVAVAVGSSVIEKHITIDRSMEGPDHKFAIEPDELSEMITRIRTVEQMLGSGRKEILEIETETPTGEQCLHAAEQIPGGTPITDANSTILRPVDGECEILPSEASDVYGMKTTKSIQKGEKIYRSDLT